MGERGMSLSEITGIGSLLSALGRRAGGVDSEYERLNPRVAGLFHVGTPRVLAGREPEVERTPRSRTTLSNSTERVLSAHQFECLLERERSLADRGTRRFSLLVLRRRAGAPVEPRGRDALAELARQGCKRLRSTDVVGRLDAARVAILLTDTQPAGAQVVAAWVDQVESKLGLDLEHTIYVYPSVAEPSTDGGQDGGPHAKDLHEALRSNGFGNGQLTRRREGAANTHAAAVAENGSATNGKSDDGHLNGHSRPSTHETSVRTDGVVSEGRRPMEDLWPLLGVPTPLWKRSLDILSSALALLMLLPLFVLIAIAIRLDSRDR
jgi:hypothetical protein